MAASSLTTSTTVYFQAHRGSMDEAPENTMPAFRHAWQFRGAIPETDVRTTADGALICLHDATLARTTNAHLNVRDVDVSQLTLAQVREWDAGIRFDPAYAGETVPTLHKVLALLMEEAERRLYLEPKAAALPDLEEIVSAYDCLNRLLFVHHSPAMLQQIQDRFPGAPTMSWISGTPTEIQQKFEALAQTNFAGISQLQLHLPTLQSEPEIVYAFDAAYIRYIQTRIQAANVSLQLCPFVYTAASLRPLLELGVEWFVTNGPERFSVCLRATGSGK